MSLDYHRQQALQSHETVATVLHAILRERYGDAVYEWDPLTVYLEAKADFAADMSTEAVDRWCAMQVVMTSDAFFTRLDAFLAVCNTLAGGNPFFGVFDPATVEEIAWAIVEVALNREMRPFAYAIEQYIKITLKQGGYTEEDYPSIFDEALGPRPAGVKIRDGLAALQNNTNIESYIDEQLAAMVSQFDRIPGLKMVDDIILRRGFDEAIRSAQQGVTA